MATPKTSAKKTTTSQGTPGSTLGTVGLAAPWTFIGNLIKNVFANDESVTVTTDRKESCGIYNIYIACDDAVKLAAIKKLVGEERVYGNITVKINYTEPDVSATEITADDVIIALRDTGYFVKNVHLDTKMGKFDCPIVAKEIIQFYNDERNEYYGNINLTVADALLQMIQDDVIPENMFISTANGTEILN